MSRDDRIERRLAEGLARLAERAVTSPDALERILRAGTDAEPVRAPVTPGRAPAGAPGGGAAGGKAPGARAPGGGATRGRAAAVGGGDLVDLTPLVQRRKPRRATVIAPLLGLVAAAIVAVAVVVPGIRQGSGRTRQLQTASPSKSYRGSVGHSGPTRVAWLANGTLFIGAGGAGVGGAGTGAIAVGAGSNPEWSADGKWLAYLSSPHGSSGPYQIRVVRYDGSDNHQVLSAPGFAAFLWSPSADVVAAVPLSPSGTSAGLVVAGTSGAPRYLLKPSTPVNSMMWSRDGRFMAYSGPEGVLTIPAGGGKPTVVPYAAPAGATVVLAGWWPGDRGLLLWPDPPGAVEANGLALTAVPLQGGPGQVLGTTQVFLRWLAWSPDGTRLAFVTGGGASPASGKALELCSLPAATSAAAWSCRTLPQPAGTVTLDPAWAPNSNQIAFVRAEAAPPSGPFGTFFGSRTLYLASSDGSGAHPVPTRVPAGSATRSPRGAPTGSAPLSTGVVLPAWTANGSQIGYSTGSHVVIAPAGGGPAGIVASGLSGNSLGSSIGNDYYGKAPWGGTATWSTGPGSAAEGDS
ncbi:MAG: TolB family protein [Acidimicrobiales bacterium]